MHRPPKKTHSITITKPLAFVDLETTGRVVGLDRIVEIGILKIPPGDAGERQFETRVNPETLIPKEATQIHGIRNSRLDSGVRASLQ